VCGLGRTSIRIVASDDALNRQRPYTFSGIST
jgi:hypothetical protein